MQLLILSPQSQASSPAPRSGVTLAEVLISIGILAVGLLGAAAMFPVGSYFMQKGEVADRGAAIAQAAFADLVARGDLNPDNWRAWDAGNSVYQPMGQMMRDWMVSNAGVRINDSEADFQTQMNTAAGFVYIIDPLGTAGAVRANSGSSSIRTDIMAAPMRIPMPPAFAAAEFQSWPVRRLCTKSMVMGDKLPSEPVAQSLYTSGDDLAFDLPEEGDRPSQQQVIKGQNASGDTVAIARQNRGDYSWMAMVVPTESNAREALGLNPSAYYFDVSVIVFYKRPIASIADTESLVKGYIVATGTGGGEILLDSDPLTDAYDDFKAGQWVMVSGPHPASTPTEPLFFSQWYRVLTINDAPDNGQAGSSGPRFDNETTQRRIGLRGPDWPWKTAGTPVRVGIFPGAVAVHTKTMRLESTGPYSR